MYKKLLRTAGYTSIIFGLYLVYKGSDDELYTTKFKPREDVIDAEWFEVRD